MALRQVAGDPKVRIKNIEESVEKAKEAVELDINDGTSWREYLNLNLFSGLLLNPVGSLGTEPTLRFSSVTVTEFRC